MRILFDNDIDRVKWNALIQTSATATWFQSPEAFDFFAQLPELFQPFAVGIINPSLSEASPLSTNSASSFSNSLRGIAVGYVTVEKCAIKQFLTRRAIIVGGPCLADDCRDKEVEALMSAVRNWLKSKAIYIETRNFNNYLQWKDAFMKSGFCYQPHLNFHVHTHQPWEAIEANIGKHRRKYIRLSFRDGVTVEENPTIEQVRAYYDILLDLYKTKVKMPLQPWSFFERLYYLKSCRYLLVMFDGQVVGGSICMVLKKTPITNDQSTITTSGGVYEWYACGKDGVFKNIHPSSVTKYAGMKYASDNGYAVFDMMGAGKPNEEYGVRDFKAEFGGELVEHGRFLCVTKPFFYKMGVLGVKILKKIK